MLCDSQQAGEETTKASKVRTCHILNTRCARRFEHKMCVVRVLNFTRGRSLMSETSILSQWATYI